MLTFHLTNTATLGIWEEKCKCNRRWALPKCSLTTIRPTQIKWCLRRSTLQCSLTVINTTPGAKQSISKNMLNWMMSLCSSSSKIILSQKEEASNVSIKGSTIVLFLHRETTFSLPQLRVTPTTRFQLLTLIGNTTSKARYQVKN